MVAALVALAAGPVAIAVADPVILRQPTDQTVTAGESAVFKANAMSWDTVQWQVSTNGGAKWEPVVSSGSSEVLTIQNTTAAEDGYEYRAVFVGEGVEVPTQVARLTVNLPPGVTTQPVNVALMAGETATFTAAASGRPAPTTQWQVSTNGGETFINDTTDSGNTTARLTISTSVAENGYKYRAVFRNTAGSAASTPATLTVSSPVPPAASFAWFPAAPFVGEPVSFASNSTDALSPITAFAWDLAGNGRLVGGGPVLSTWFSSPGAHVVRLRVTDAKGLSSIVAETIPVGLAPPSLLQPFPVVRLVGFDTSSGVQLVVFTVLAPVTARITITCRGRGCPTKLENRLAVSRRHKRKAGALLIAFPRFERSLRAGITLEVRVSKPNRIGKYTKFVIRRGKVPARMDACLNPVNSRPMPCPSS
jgi:Immunoglobulin domain/PKD domain